MRACSVGASNNKFYLFDTSLSPLMMSTWRVIQHQFWMKECDILRRSKHTPTPPTYFPGVKTPNPRIYACTEGHSIQHNSYKDSCFTLSITYLYLSSITSDKNIIHRIINIINHSHHSHYFQQWTLNCIYVVLPISRYLWTYNISFFSQKLSTLKIYHLNVFDITFSKQTEW